jgi:predicted transcriptional regulator
MKATVQARLDSDSQRQLQRLARELGWSPSRVVREGLRLLAACHAQAPRKIAGMGQFRSGISDLGSNKAHLKDFGR